MIKIDKNGISTPWMSRDFTEKDLKKLKIDQLLLLCRHKNKIGNSFKDSLIQHLLKNK